MKNFNEPKVSHAFSNIIRFIIQKIGKNMIPENSDRKRMYGYPFWNSLFCTAIFFLEISKIVAADVESLVPGNINEV